MARLMTDEILAAIERLDMAMRRIEQASADVLARHEAAHAVSNALHERRYTQMQTAVREAVALIDALVAKEQSPKDVTLKDSAQWPA
jgi:hypothetical protein